MVASKEDKLKTTENLNTINNGIEEIKKLVKNITLLNQNIHTIGKYNYSLQFIINKVSILAKELEDTQQLIIKNHPNLKNKLNYKEIPLQLKPLKAPLRLNLVDEILNPFAIDIKQNIERYWYAQEQLEALKMFTNFKGQGLGILKTYRIGDYQGEYYAIMEYKDYVFLWRDSFGSCCGCDGLDGSNSREAYEYIKETLKEGNTLQFYSINHAKEFINFIKDEDNLYGDYYWWKEFPLSLFEDLDI